MKMNKLFTIALAIVMAFSFAFIVADDSSADVSINPDVKTSGFTDVDAGKLTVYFDNTSSHVAIVDLTVIDSESGNVKAEKNGIEVPAETEKFAVSVSFSYSSQGTYYVDVYADVDGAPIMPQMGIEINVVHSIWKDSGTYVAIIAVIIVIVVIAYLYMRGAPGRAAAKGVQAKTFTELENEKKMKKTGSPTQVEKYESSEKRTRRK